MVLAWCLVIALATFSSAQVAPHVPENSEPSNNPGDSKIIPADESVFLLPGVVVEDVEKYSTTKGAGFRAGDILLNWSRAEANGTFVTPLDVFSVLMEQGPQGIITLEGSRAGKPISWKINSDQWDIKSRLNFSPSLLSEYRKANELLRARKPEEAYAHFQIVASFLPKLSSARTSLLLNAVSSLGSTYDQDKLDQAFRAVVESASGNPSLNLFIYWFWASAAWSRKDHNRAIQLCDQAIGHAEHTSRPDLTVAYLQLGCMSIAVDKGDLASSERYALSARKVWERLAPNSTGALANLVSLGSIMSDRGDLELSEQYYREIVTRWTRSNLIFMLADAYWGLGWLDRLRGDYASAERYYRKALAIYQRQGSPAVGTAQLLSNLAFLAEERGDFSTAQKYLDGAMKLKAGTRVHVSLISQLGVLRKRQGDLVNARKYLEQAREIRAKSLPGSLALSATLMDLGDIALATGDLTAAEHYYREALGIRQKEAPRSAENAIALAAVAGILTSKRQTDEALGLYDRALQALESQTSRLGGDNDVRSDFRAKHAGIYSQYIALLLSQNKQDVAFSVLERFRARSTLEMLTTAHVELHGEADPSLIETERSLKMEIKSRSDRRIRLMGESSDQKQEKAVEKEVADLLLQYHDVEAQIRATSPAYAALTQPQPLTAKEVQTKLLDENTLLLEYSLGEERSYVFAVTPGSLQAFELPKRAQVEKAARRVYSLLTARNISVKGETAQQKQARLARG